MLRKSLGYLVLTAVLALLIWYVKANLEDFTPLLEISPAYIGLILTASLVYVCIQGILYNSVLSVFGLRLTFSEALGTVVLTLFGNYFFPFAGFGFRGVYLKRVYGVALKDYSITVVALVFVELLVYALFGLIALALLNVWSGISDITLSLFFALASAGCLLAFVARIPFVGKIPLLRPANALLETWYSFRKNRAILLRLVGLTILQFIAYASLFLLAFGAINIDISMAESALHAALSDFGFLFKVAPAGIGTYEALVIYTADLNHHTISEGVMVLLLVRAATIVWPLMLAPIFIPRFTSKLQVEKFSEVVAPK